MIIMMINERRIINYERNLNAKPKSKLDWYFEEDHLFKKPLTLYYNKINSKRINSYLFRLSIELNKKHLK